MPELTADLQQLKLALEAARIGTWEFDLVHQRIHWDQLSMSLFGFSSLERAYDDAFRFIHPDDHLTVRQAVARALSPDSGGDYDITYRVIGAQDGRLRWLHCLGQASFDDQGQARRFVGTVQDVTSRVDQQQVTQQQRLLESEQIFRSLIEQAPVATCLYIGREMTVAVANPAMLGYWGKSITVLGLPLAQALPELEGQAFLGLLEQVYTTGQTHASQAAPAQLVVGGRLQTFYFDYTYKPLFNGQGQVYAIMNMAVDVTARVLAQRQMEEAQRSLQSAVDLAELGTWSVDVGSGQVSYSPRFNEWMGLGQQTMIERAFDAVDPRQAASIEAAYQRALTAESGGRMNVEFWVANIHTGQPRVMHVVGQAQFNEQGQAVVINGFAQDVTPQRAAQAASEQLVAERTRELQIANQDLLRSNDSLQQFAYVASHDLQEPLRKIQSFGQLLQTQYGSQLGEGVDHLQRMQSAASRMSTLIRDLLSYSRITPHRDKSSQVDLDSLVEQVLIDLDMLIEEAEAVVTVEPLPTLAGDGLQLGQLFQNLLSNALKFRRPDVPPQISVRTRVLAVSDLPPRVHPAQPAQAYYRIDVVDNGIGFDEKYADRIFQVFQRLHGKEKYAGTGIGLAICAKVASNHGGAITASSQSEQGATFSVYLPA